MDTIELQKGEQLKVIGQKSVCMILINVDGEIYSKIDSNREREDATHKNCEPFNHVEGISYPNPDYIKEQKGCGKKFTLDKNQLYDGGLDFQCGEIIGFAGHELIMLCDKCKENAPKENEGK